jgi:hypothetical protein
MVLDGMWRKRGCFASDALKCDWEREFNRNDFARYMQSAFDAGKPV